MFNETRIYCPSSSPTGGCADAHKFIPVLLPVPFKSCPHLLPSLSHSSCLLDSSSESTDRNLPWLPPLVAPHPRADLKEPSAISSALARTSVCDTDSVMTDATAMQTGRVLVGKLLPARKQERGAHYPKH